MQCEQHRYTPLVLDRLAALDAAEVRFGSTVTGVEQEDGQVTVDLEHRGRRERLAGACLVGADGARSAVRSSIGVPFEGLTYPQRYLVLTTTFDMRSRIPDIAHVNYISDPEQWVTALRLPGIWRLMFPVPPEEDEHTVVGDESVFAHMRRFLGDADFDVVHRTLYRVHQRVAERFREGRVLLAGDAAHINNPLGGMGMNSGLHDALDLGRRLAAVWHGRAEEDELDTWAHQRRSVSRDIVGPMSHGNWAAIKAADPEERRRHHDELQRTAGDPELARRYLLRTTLIDSLRETGALPRAGASFRV